MKIAHVYWFGPKEPGGISNMLAEEVQNYPEDIDGHIVYMEDCDPDFAKMIPKEVRVTTLGRKRGSGVPGTILPIIRLNLLLKKLRPDVVVFHALELSGYVVGRGFKRIGRIHNTNIDAKDFDLKMDRFVAISGVVKNDVVERVGVSPDSISVVYNGVYIDKFEKKQTLRPLNRRPVKIVQVSRLFVKQKAQDLALRALKSCVDTYGFSNWTYTLIGTGSSEGLLRDLAIELGIEDKVVFEGQLSRDEMYHRLKEFDLFLLPSHYEGFGNVVVEAMAAGLPVLCSDIDGPQEILREGALGYLFKVGDADDCAAKIIELCTRYGSVSMNERVERASEFARLHFDVSTMTNELVRIYREHVCD